MIYYIEDPNAVNINGNIENAVPQYQDMNIFAELTAVRRGRSVLVIGKGVQKNGLDKDFEVNFIGSNQNKSNDDNMKNPDYLNFTSNYYDGSTPDNQIQYESFGMSSIKVVINSSYVPQVNIQFVDVRGLSFFNQENSPYRILFDFPPPIFNLKFKGYYGMALEYKLHLVKYNTEFNANNGNFVIDAQFVAMTFAPLTDVLFRYIVNFPLINSSISVNPDIVEPPKNTNSLILKIKSLLSDNYNPLKNSGEKIDFDDASRKLDIIQTSLRNVHQFKSALEGNSIIFTKDKNDDDITKVTVLINPKDYDKYIMSMSSENKPDNIDKRLCIGYIGNESNKQALLKKLDDYRKDLMTLQIRTSVLNILDTDISEPKPIYIDSNKVAADDKTKTLYCIIDITDFYYKLYIAEKLVMDSRKKIGESLVNKINASIEDTLGMRPTIYNIFNIILRDVDSFFKILRNTSKAAHEHHNKETIKQIIGNGDNMMDSGTKSIGEIYSFPLLIKEDVTGCPKVTTRTSPVDLNEKMLSDPMPEMTLIENFVRTFSAQKTATTNYFMKLEVDSDGTKKWIPISPIDSVLSGTNPSTPYAGLANFNEMMSVFINRFYVLTQSAYPSDFYSDSDDVREAYINLFSKSEALNLGLSLTGELKKSNLVFTTVNDFVTNGVEKFYTYLDTDVSQEYALTNNTVVINDAYVDRENPNYLGINIYDENIETQVLAEEKGNPIDNFADDVQRGLFKRIWSGGKLPEESYSFTQDNVVYIKDTFVKKNTEKSGRVNTDVETRYLCEIRRIGSNNDEIRLLKEFVDIGVIDDNLNRLNSLVDYFLTTETKLLYKYPKESFIKNHLRQYGNSGIYVSTGWDAKALRNFQSIVDIWTMILAANDKTMYDEIIYSGSTDNQLASVIILSNFGYTLGPYNVFPNELNSGVFSIPSAIEVPTFLPAYIGALIDADTNGLREKIENFYLTGGGKNIYSGGIFTLADITDINTNMSEEDKKIFKRAYTNFMDGGLYAQIKKALSILYNDVENQNPENQNQRAKLYDNLLNPESKGVAYFNVMLLPLMRRTKIICFSQITFGRGVTLAAYRSLKNINLSTTENDKKNKEINSEFFRAFFIELSRLIAGEDVKTKKIEDENKKILGDDDVITQLYYSFKNINDKWLCNPEKEPENNGYPYNKPNGSLIDSFIFVDRAMRPIGNTCINPEILLDLFNDTNISVYSVLSQLLSLNGFLFFPLQNFMSYSNEDWDNSFKIDPSAEITKQEAFVCLYAGGSSSYPNNLGNGFKDDGIIDIGTTDATDFKECTGDNVYDENDKQLDHKLENKKDIFNTVRAFKVLFGQQNQSMFSDIKIDSKEFPETNESIQILARLAGDGGQQPVPKGQNLYNLYENRAYSATITGLGNAMIQPTQYFQLDNVPLFNGAYLILGVEHNITPNKMETSFTGTKILKYPVPRVTSPVASMGMFKKYAEFVDTASTDSVTQLNMSSDENTHYNAMYGNTPNSLKMSNSSDISNTVMSNYFDANLDFPYTLVDFPDNQYFKEQTDKKQIVLHHTVSGQGVNGDITWWKGTPDKVGTAILIDKNGKIYQCFNDAYWAYHLGTNAANNKALNMSSIGIEIDAWGGLVKSSENGLWYPAKWDASVKKYVPNRNNKNISNVFEYPNGYRGFYGFEKYSDAQIEAIKQLLIYWGEKYKIPLDYNTDMWDISSKALSGQAGVWVHNSYRTDKSDCYPDDRLIDMLNNLK